MASDEVKRLQEYYGSIRDTIMRPGTSSRSTTKESRYVIRNIPGRTLVDVGDRYIPVQVYQVNCVLDKTGYVEYVIDYVERVCKLVDVMSIHITEILFQKMSSRARYYWGSKTIVLDPTSKSFSPSYRGYAYKKFGGRADLTPGGVFAHECGHGLTNRHKRGLKNAFAKIRKINRKSMTSYGTSNWMEDVAECFRLYVSNPDLLLNLDRARYSAIHRFADKYMLD